MAGSGLQIYDISDPRNPQQLGQFFIGREGSGGVSVAGDFAILSLPASGVVIFDISDPAHPDSVGFFACHPYGVRLQGETAFIADRTQSDDGIKAVDIRNPANPVLLASYDTPGWPLRLAVSGGYIYLADRNSLMVLRYTGARCQYIPSDINGNGSVNGVDIVYAVNYFKGTGAPPPIDCFPACPGTPNPFYAAADVNGNCAVNGIDVTFFVRFLKGQVPSLLYCPDCPAMER